MMQMTLHPVCPYACACARVCAWRHSNNCVICVIALCVTARSAQRGRTATSSWSVEAGGGGRVESWAVFAITGHPALPVAAQNSGNFFFAQFGLAAPRCSAAFHSRAFATLFQPRKTSPVAHSKGSGLCFYPPIQRFWPPKPPRNSPGGGVPHRRACHARTYPGDKP